MRTWNRRKWVSTSCIAACMSVVIIFTFPAGAQADRARQCGGMVVYDGRGAGQVVFDGKLHTEKGLTCADCHESRSFSLALFSMQKGDNDVSMRKMELGRSCGYCHEVSMQNTLTCDKCHRK